MDDIYIFYNYLKQFENVEGEFFLVPTTSDIQKGTKLPAYKQQKLLSKLIKSNIIEKLNPISHGFGTGCPVIIRKIRFIGELK